MTQSSAQDSAILYHNAENTIFLIDTPHSIALAQESPSRKQDKSRHQSTLSSANANSKRRWLFSTPPLENPFPSTEPKSHAARAKVLERIPASELRFHGEFIQPLVESALEILRTEYRSRDGDGRWCLPRRVCGDESRRQVEISTRDAGRTVNSARKRRNEDLPGDKHLPPGSNGQESLLAMPPVILSSTGVTSFESLSELNGSIVKNVSSESATLAIRSSSPSPSSGEDIATYTEYIIPPQANFIICTLPLSYPAPNPFNPFPGTETLTLDSPHPIPAFPITQKFNLLLFDPPWPNRSVRRSGHYQVHHYSEMDLLTQRLRDILRVHSFHTSPPSPDKDSAREFREETRVASRASLAAIWITNAEKARRAAYESLVSTGFRVVEEWVWVKTTIDGSAISAVDGLWRKPYEILVIGRADGITGRVDLEDTTTTMDICAVEDTGLQENDLLGIDPAGIKRRVIAAVPDLHSRKPNLKEVFERVFFMDSDCNETESNEVDAGIQSYSALEVFARNCTAGWWACGNEVLKFNARECWVDDCDT